MSTMKITAQDGHAFSAYCAKPQGAPRGGLIVIQEFFGVNGHIRRVCDQYAADGYLALSPAIFDRVERDVELGYDEAGMNKGRELRAKLDLAEECVTLLPRLAEARYWHEDGAGEVTFVAADGQPIVEFFAADGVAYESLRPLSPLVALTAK